MEILDKMNKPHFDPDTMRGVGILRQSFTPLTVQNSVKVSLHCSHKAPLFLTLLPFRYFFIFVSITKHRLTITAALTQSCFLPQSLSDNAQGRLLATHTKCAEGVLGEWTD